MKVGTKKKKESLENHLDSPVRPSLSFSSCTFQPFIKGQHVIEQFEVNVWHLKKKRKKKFTMSAQSIWFNCHISFIQAMRISEHSTRLAVEQSPIFFHLRPQAEQQNVPPPSPLIRSAIHNLVNFVNQGLFGGGQQQQTPSSSFTPRVIAAKLPSNSFLNGMLNRDW